MLTLIDFNAVWCGPCQAMKPVIKKVIPNFAGKVELKEIDVDNNQSEASKYGVMGIPTFVIEKDGKEVSRRTGWMSDSDLTNWLNSLL